MNTYYAIVTWGPCWTRVKSYYTSLESAQRDLYEVQQDGRNVNSRINAYATRREAIAASISDTNLVGYYPNNNNL